MISESLLSERYLTRQRHVSLCTEVKPVTSNRKGIPVSLSARGVEAVRDALKKGARLGSVETLETVLYQPLREWLQNVTE
jgi:hypothetical protein